MPNASKPGTIYQTNRWRTRIRRTVLERDGFACRTCGARGKDVGGAAVLTVAHLVPVRLAPHLAEDLRNLRTLCQRCHGREDGGRRYR